MMARDSDAALPYLALGDSYSIGEGLAVADSWPMQLARALRADGTALADPRIVARTGWSTDELAAALDAAEPLGTHAFVSLLIGVNNQYRGRELDNYRDEFTALLQRAIGYAGGRTGRVLVLSIPDWGATAFGQASGRDLAQVARELDEYNATARACCRARDVAWVDITAMSRRHDANPEMLAADGLHPSAAAYGDWVDAARPVAARLLAT